MTEQYLRRKTLSSSSNYFQSAKKNPLHPNKDGRHRTDNDESISTTNSGSHHRQPLDNNIAYFPDHIARVSYIASVVRPEADGSYLDELQGGMKLLATRLAPSYFPGTIVRQITTQVDGYYPSACPSTKFDNCQDVTASIGVYLRAVPDVWNEGSRTSTSGERTRAGMPIDPSAMTDELLAFEESLNTAIANNELQAAIRQQYLRNDIENSNPGVVIVTDTVNGWDFGTVSENDFGTIYDTVDSSSATIGVAVRDPSISNTSIAAAKSPNGRNNAGLATIGITGTALFSVMLVLWIVGGRKRSDDRRTEEVIVDVKEKIKKHHQNRHSTTMKLDRSKQKLLDDGDEEEGFTGRTMRTVNSDSTHTSSSNERLLKLVATSSALVGDVNLDDLNKSGAFQNTSDKNDLIAKKIVTGDDLLGRSNVVDAESGADDEDDSHNDFVLGEDDDSEASVGQHLLSVSRSSECRTPQSADSPTPSIEFFLDETVEGTINSDAPDPSPQENLNTPLREPKQISSSNSLPEENSRFDEFDQAVTNKDWAAVGAAAAVFASEAKTPQYKRTKLRRSSSSSENDSNYSKGEEELDQLIQNGDWQGIVATAAKFDTEVESIGENTIEENDQSSKRSAHDSDRSKVSTHGSDTNDSNASIMDNSSDGRSITRSVGTSASQKERIEDIRLQVIELVRDVAPDEEENVDEMIRQFNGREEELLETLLGMKEKVIARKARTESQRIAKRNAKAQEKANESEASASDNQSSCFSDIESNDSSITERRHNLSPGPKMQGGFENATRADHSKAAADAAAWAIQRSYEEMVERERNGILPDQE